MSCAQIPDSKIQGKKALGSSENLYDEKQYDEKLYDKKLYDEKLLRSDERASLLLRGLYSRYGYMPYRMSKFEEYELYMRNKDFLISDRIITFNDTDDRLLALKPDVTLSIIKNGRDVKGYKQKVCYNENVYRISESTHRFKEIMQTGIECIGDLDIYDVYEAIYLAARSLSLLSESYILDISHMGIIASAIDELGDFDEGFRGEALRYIAQKNAHDLSGLCASQGLSNEAIQELCEYINIYGDRADVIKKIERLCKSEKSRQALKQLREISRLLDDSDVSEHIRYDFSVVNDMNYYNGIVFRGFIDGISEGVLAGGRYDDLVRKMGRNSQAIGFAIYIDLLESINRTHEDVDVECILLYDDTTDRRQVARKVREITRAGRSVVALTSVPDRLRYNEVIDIRN